MSESLKSILSALDYSQQPSWTQYWMRDWPEGEFERCLASGLFVPQEPTDQIPCTVCGEIVDVLRITKSSGQIEACLKCSLCGNHFVPQAMAGRWDLNLRLFVDLLAVALAATGETQLLVRDRVWRLGKCKLAGSSRNAYLARRLQQRDGREVVEAASFPPGAVVFVPRIGLPPELRIEPLPTLIFLTDVLTWEKRGFSFDMGHIEAQLAAAASAMEMRVEPKPRRGSRLVLIASLKRELTEHLRAARDHALATGQAGREPVLLPRPTQEQLARQLGVNKATICRCLEDRAAGDLRRLWEAAGNLGRLVS